MVNILGEIMRFKHNSMMMQLNVKAISVVSIVGLVLVYLVYSWMTTVVWPSSKSAAHAKEYNVWKNIESVDIPADILSMMKEIKIEERTLEFSVDDQVII